MPFSSHKKYPKTKKWQTLWSYFGQMTEMSHKKNNFQVPVAGITSLGVSLTFGKSGAGKNET